MMRFFKWAAVLLLVPVLLAVLFIAFFPWNMLRGPIERLAMEKTGRALVINGDLKVKLDWPLPRIHADAVSFANPGWAREKQMVTADAVEIVIDLPQLLRKKIVLPEVWLEHPVIFLEQGSAGRKNWLLDVNQQDQSASIRIDRLTLDRGHLGYDDAGLKTSIRVELSTSIAPSTGTELGFTAEGQYKGQPFKASGNGGPVLGLRDENTPYPLKMDLTVGHTGVRAEGSITSLLQFSALDMHLTVHGKSLAQLFPLLGIALPETGAYVTEGHLVHGKKMWRYMDFSGRFGKSDIAGTIQVDTGGRRPSMTANLVSRVLDIADLGPLIGARPGSLKTAQRAALATPQPTVTTSVQARILPDLPFNTERWDSVDADVTLKAGTIIRAKELPLEDLLVHLRLRDSVLTLDPLNLGFAGGQLNSTISLDGRKDPIQTQARVRAKKISLAKLFPTVNLNKNSIGEINGEFDLTGTGNSVGQMLANSNGRVGLIVAGGEISKMMMEKVGLHLWEILQLKMSGDRLIKLRCGVADFNVKAGIMHANALIFDTEITTIVATGTIDLRQERLDLTLNQKTKDTSPLALRSPITIRGNFASPAIEVNKLRVVERGLGAMALAVANPLLTLLPLIDAGPGKDSDCGQLVRDARALPH